MRIPSCCWGRTSARLQTTTRSGGGARFLFSIKTPSIATTRGICSEPTCGISVKTVQKSPCCDCWASSIALPKSNCWLCYARRTNLT